MLQYQPPKSSVWGHSLRRMPADRACALFKQFLDIAVVEYKWSASRMCRNYEALTENEFTEHLQAIIQEESLGSRSHSILSQRFEISKWRIEGQIIPTDSTITMGYGESSYVGTRLQFDGIAQFNYIRRVLENLRLCKLNEKHLRPKRA